MIRQSTPHAPQASAVRTATPLKETAALDIDAGQTPTLAITGERTVPGVWHENYWLSTTPTLCKAAL